MPINTKESGLETLIVDWLVTQNGYDEGTNDGYNREYAIDEPRLFGFLEETQPKLTERLGIRSDGPERTKFLNRLCAEVAKRGVIDVLRNGVNVYPAEFVMFYPTPSEKNPQAAELFGKNVFSVMRQLQYSRDSTRALDLCIFINGLPVITCELKNRLTLQNVDDAVEQYKSDRDPRELLFQFKRCVAHFAVDDDRVKFCTKLTGKESLFLPFDRGHNSGAGNPPNPNGIMTDYLWKDILARGELADIIENYAQVVEEKDVITKKVTHKQVFPRYHQLSVVKALLADVRERGVGRRYLVQHSAGSGKSNSIAWLARQLVELEVGGENLIDSVIVVTDRRNLDRQIKNTIKQFAQVSSTVKWAERSGELRKAIENGKKIIISTIQKFPHILDEIGSAHKNNKFAIILDEAHSSQSGSFSASMNIALRGEGEQDDDMEDTINRLVEGRKLLSNASYFAFTATPKNKTLEMFGEALPQPGGVVKHTPFHNYSMKQAIQEGFILDVLMYYTPIKSYYKLIKTIADDPQFDRLRARKKLRHYVEGNEYPIGKKADIIVEHFHSQVKHKIDGRARAMVVTGGIERAIEYYHAITERLKARKSPYKAIVAFSDKHNYGGKMLSEADINGFPSAAIEEKFRSAEEPYRFLIVADKFQTGYDEPLLHTMYVDKVLTDIKAVQTLSRLNRAAPMKFDTFVLDFANEPEDIQKAFERYYRTTILSGETDPNKLYDLIAAMEAHEVYTQHDVESLVEKYLGGTKRDGGAMRDKLDPVLDACADLYRALDEDAQVKFKTAAKAFVRAYGFLGAILPYGNPKWEKLSIFLNLLLPKLPSPIDEGFPVEFLESIDLESYRAEAQAQIAISLEDADAEVDPVPEGDAGGKSEPENDFLSSIIREFNDLFGDIEWEDADNVREQIKRMQEKVAQNTAYLNAMKNANEQEARSECDRAVNTEINSILTDSMELVKHFSDNPSFKRLLEDMVFRVTYKPAG